ncbi:MAG: PIN domain-containing protein [Treponema sp.]|nr:PIN domain-containing protein [Treponema sp.]
MTVIDTNVILRYLLNDIQEQADKAAAIIEEGAKSYPEIIAEVVYVLVKLYSVPREKINEIVSPITYEVEFDNSDVIRTSLENFSNTKFDFVDCLLLARKKILSEEIFTFDKKLANRLKEE